MSTLQSSTSIITNEIISQWFSKLISEIRVDKEMMEAEALGSGHAMAFGPGLAIEGMRFTKI